MTQCRAGRKTASPSRFRCEVGGGLGGAPGLRPECEFASTVSTKGMTLRAEGWPASSGRRAVAVLSPNPISLRRVGGICEPRPECDRVSPSTLRHRSMSRCQREPFQTRSRSIRSRRRKVAGQASPPGDGTGVLWGGLTLSQPPVELREPLHRFAVPLPISLRGDGLSFVTPFHPLRHRRAFTQCCERRNPVLSGARLEGGVFTDTASVVLSVSISSF